MPAYKMNLTAFQVGEVVQTWEVEVWEEEWKMVA